MEELQKLRQKINVIDDALVDLFIKRMKVVNDIAEYKIKNSMEILDRSREELIIKKYTENINDKALESNIEEFLKRLMAISRKAQAEIIHETFR